MQYHKIQSIFKRDEKGVFTNEYALPEFEYLKDNIWVFTEKIDGTNIRIIWENGELSIRGKTDKAQIPASLQVKLEEIFTIDKMKKMFPESNVILYGEGFGAKIQGGGKYISDGVDFILFDILIGEWWLHRQALEDIAGDMNLKIVEIVGEGGLQEALTLAKEGFFSEFGDFCAEGIVLRPKVQLFSQRGDRIITKVKHKDFK